MPETAEEIQQGNPGILKDVAAIQAGVSSDAALQAAAPLGASKWRHKAAYWLAFIFQGITWPLFYIGYHLAFNLRIHGKENLRGVKGPVIFVANHIGVFDSFIFDLFVPPFTSIPPFRFMGTSQFDILYLKIMNYTGIINLIYWVFGVFKVTYGKGAEVALIPAYGILKEGGTVAMFPEGVVWRYDRYDRGIGKKEPVGPFKRGAGLLAKNTGAIVIPVALNQHPKNMFRDNLDVMIGKPYAVDRTQTAEALADEMKRKVEKLFYQYK